MRLRINIPGLYSPYTALMGLMSLYGLPMIFVFVFVFLFLFVFCLLFLYGPQRPSFEGLPLRVFYGLMGLIRPL